MPWSIIFAGLPITNVMPHFRWTFLCPKKFLFLITNVNTTNRMSFLLVSAAFYSTDYSHGPFVTLTHPPKPAHRQCLMHTDFCVSTASSACSSLFPRPQKLSLLYKAGSITWSQVLAGWVEKDQECQCTLPRARGPVLAWSLMHVFSDVLHLHTHPSIHFHHFYCKAQYDTC